MQYKEIEVKMEVSIGYSGGVKITVINYMGKSEKMPSVVWKFTRKMR